MSLLAYDSNEKDQLLIIVLSLLLCFRAEDNKINHKHFKNKTKVGPSNSQINWVASNNKILGGSTLFRRNNERFYLRNKKVCKKTIDLV